MRRYAQGDKNDGDRLVIESQYPTATVSGLASLRALPSGRSEEGHAGQREDVTEEERCLARHGGLKDGTDSARGGAARATSARWHMTMQLVVAPLYQEARAGRVRIEGYLPEPGLHFIHLLRLARRSANADHSFPPNKRAEELGSLTQLICLDQVQGLLNPLDVDRDPFAITILAHPDATCSAVSSTSTRWPHDENRVLVPQTSSRRSRGLQIRALVAAARSAPAAE